MKLEILHLELFFAQIFSLGKLEGARFSVVSLGTAPWRPDPFHLVGLEVVREPSSLALCIRKQAQQVTTLASLP